MTMGNFSNQEDLEVATSVLEFQIATVYLIIILSIIMKYSVQQVAHA